MMQDKSRSHRLLLTRRLIEAVQKDDYSLLGYEQLKTIPLFNSMHIGIVADYAKSGEELLYTRKALKFWSGLKDKPFKIKEYTVYTGKGYMHKKDVAYKYEDLQKLIEHCKFHYDNEVNATDVFMTVREYAYCRGIKPITVYKRLEKYKAAIEEGKKPDFKILSKKDKYTIRELDSYSVDSLDKLAEMCKRVYKKKGS